MRHAQLNPLVRCQVGPLGQLQAAGPVSPPDRSVTGYTSILQHRKHVLLEWLHSLEDGSLGIARFMAGALQIRMAQSGRSSQRLTSRGLVYRVTAPRASPKAVSFGAQSNALNSEIRIWMSLTVVLVGATVVLSLGDFVVAALGARSIDHDVTVRRTRVGRVSFGRAGGWHQSNRHDHEV